MGTERGEDLGAKCSITSTGGEKDISWHHKEHDSNTHTHIVASSNVLSLSPKGGTQCVYSLGLFFCFCKNKVIIIVRARSPATIPGSITTSSRLDAPVLLLDVLEHVSRLESVDSSVTSLIPGGGGAGDGDGGGLGLGLESLGGG
jgi:hypothetical protein